MSKNKHSVSAIAAISSNGMLGANGWLPWDIPEDVAYFERMIEGAALVVGRVTYLTMTAFPDDIYVVSSRADIPLHPGSYRVDSVEKALLTAQATGKPVFVIGGAGIYEAAWPYCQDFYLNRMEGDFAGDTRFPDVIPFAQWFVVSDELQCLHDRMSGKTVNCRFMHYQQPEPRPLDNLVANSVGTDQN